jgi:hypothetical protein
MLLLLLFVRHRRVRQLKVLSLMIMVHRGHHNAATVGSLRLRILGSLRRTFLLLLLLL